ncbi:PAC2 family protein [Mariniluteicoccus endophyticus]
MVDPYSPAADLRGLTDPVVVMAFDGWNDAGSAATDAVNHLIDNAQAELAFELDPEDYYDFQVNRPMSVATDDGGRAIEWNTARVFVGDIGGRDLVLVTGPEPSMRWRSFSRALLSAIRSTGPSLVVVLGALLADTPHSRPIPVSASAPTRGIADRREVEVGTYAGPTGIVGVIAADCAAAGFDVVSLWAAVPHYVASPPNPKATLALIQRLEDTAGLDVDLTELPELARAWERGVAELVETDDELADYVEGLEAEQDETSLPEASGDAIAKEFERYLRRRDR